MEKHRPRKRVARRLLTASTGIAVLALVGCGGEAHVYGLETQPHADMSEQHVYGVVPYQPDMGGSDADHHVYGVMVYLPDLAGGDGK